MEQHQDLGRISVRDLLSLYGAILRELRSRNVIRTNNAPTGDYAEYLVAAHYQGELAPNSEKSWDVRTHDHTLIQVKARVIGDSKRAGVRQLSAIRSWDFDVLVIVLFGDGYSIARAVAVPVELARLSSSFIKHVNGHRLMANDHLLGNEEVLDITDALRTTAASI